MWTPLSVSRRRGCSRVRGQMTCTWYPAATRARASCQTRRSKGTGRFWTRIRTCGRSPRAGLVGTGASDDRGSRLPENLQVHGERPVLHVAQVEPFCFFPRQVRPAADLPQAGHAGLNHEPAPHVAAVAGHLLRQGRPGPDQGHVADQHVDELRQLIKRPAAQPGAWAGNPRVPTDLEQDPVRLVMDGKLGFALFGTRHHGPELEEGEALAVLADPGLAEEHRAVIGEPD